MPTVDGVFLLAWGQGPGRQTAYVRTLVGITDHGHPRILRVVRKVAFEVDTGSPYTILLDWDFLDLLQKMGYPDPMKGVGGPRRRRPSSEHWLTWMDGQNDSFRKSGKVCSSLGGTVPPIYRVEDSRLWFCSPDWSMPTGCAPWQPVYGTFSAAFLDPDKDDAGIPSHSSLLGRDLLNRIEGFSWSWRERKIVFNGV